MYRDAVTIWQHTGEVEREATWKRHVLVGVQVDETSGAVASMQGRQSTSGLAVYVPASAAEGYGLTWEVTEGDMIVSGIVIADTPPEGALRVSGYEPYRMRGRLHHLEVAAS